MHRNRDRVQRRHSRCPRIAISFVIWTGHSAWLDSQFNYRESSRAAIDGAMQTSPIAPLQNKQVDIVCRSVGVERGVLRLLSTKMRTKLKNCSTHCLSPCETYFPAALLCLTLENSFNKYGGAKVELIG